MAIVLGLLVAVSYGSGDFFGGIAAKRAPTLTVVIGSFVLSIGLLGLIMGTWAVVGHPPAPVARDLWLGAASGLVGPAALGCLYRGLAVGRMSVVAPITALVAAAVPLAWGLGSGERPGPVALVGVAVALAAVVLISGAPTHEDHPADAADAPLRTVIPLALGAGAGFGVIYVLLGSTGDTAALWPLVSARPTALVVTLAAAVAWSRHRGQPLRAAVVAPAAAWAAVAGAGVLDITANGLYLAASRAGLLSIVAVLASLYPAATVVLARAFLGERLHRTQLVGLALAVVGVVAMAAG